MYSLSLYIRIYIYIGAYTHAYIHIHTYTYICVYTHACVYIHVYMCMYLYTYLYIYRYILYDFSDLSHFSLFLSLDKSLPILLIFSKNLSLSVMESFCFSFLFIYALIFISFLQLTLGLVLFVDPSGIKLSCLFEICIF